MPFFVLIFIENYYIGWANLAWLSRCNQGVRNMAREIGNQVEARIMGMIEDGTVVPGARLPSERALAQAFQVSRNTVREAIRALMEKGIIVCRRGAGSYVRLQARDRIAQQLKAVLEKKQLRLTEIFEVRKMLEPSVAARAAVTATPKDLEDLAVILACQEQALARGEDPGGHDRAFHQALVRITGNSVLGSVYDTLSQVLEEIRTPDVQTPERGRLSLISHEKILAALKQGDETAAARTMTQHMDGIETMLNRKIDEDLK